MKNKVFCPSNIKTIETKYWEIIKIWLPVEKMKQFLDENNNKGWVNLNLKSSKNGKKYLELDTYLKNNNILDENDEEDEIPF